MEPPGPAPRPALVPPKPQHWGGQWWTLVRRCTASLAADRTFLAIMVALPFVMGGMARVLAGGGLTQQNTINVLLIPLRRLSPDGPRQRRARTGPLDMGAMVALSAVMAYIVARLLRRQEPAVMRR